MKRGETKSLKRMEPIIESIYHTGKTVKEWSVDASCFAKKTYNPIRATVDGMKLTPNPDKDMIALSLGDPTVFGNFPPAKEVIHSVKEALDSQSYNGYCPSIGLKESRLAIAEYFTHPVAPLVADDVILTSGCSHALELCISVLASPGQNILVPKPGFPLYCTLAMTLGIHVKHYNLLPDQSWECDIEDMDDLIDERTAAIVVTNPSNPCGSVYSKQHLKQILHVAEKHKIPIIADEIYAHMVFPGEEFEFLSRLTRSVPILSCGGIAKRYLVPGWRLGWILINDRNGVFSVQVRKGLLSLTQRILGPNTLIQAAIPGILETTPRSFYNDTNKRISDNAKFLYRELSTIPGLKPVMPQGAMYIMVGLDMDNFMGIETDRQFAEDLVTEQSVFCLPGECFEFPNYVRMVLTLPRNQVKEACSRIRQFCRKHYNNPTSPTKLITLDFNEKLENLKISHPPVVTGDGDSEHGPHTER